MLEDFNLITDEREIDYFDLNSLSYEWKGEELIELFVDDFYTGDCIVSIDDEYCSPRYYITLNYEVIYLDDIDKRK